MIGPIFILDCSPNGTLARNRNVRSSSNNIGIYYRLVHVSISRCFRPTVIVVLQGLGGMGPEITDYLSPVFRNFFFLINRYKTHGRGIDDELIGRNSKDYNYDRSVLPKLLKRKFRISKRLFQNREMYRL